MPLNFRTFEPEDAEALTALLHAAYAELSERGLNYTAVDQSVQTTLARARGGQCWVVLDGDALVGTMTITLPPSSGLQRLTEHARVPHRAWLNQVAVAPTHRGLGIVHDLWTLGQQWASDAGATSIGVDTAAPAEHLVQLYTNWGFERVDTIQWDGKRYRSAVMVQGLG